MSAYAKGDRFHGTDDDFAEVEPMVVIRMSKAEADRLQHGMADILCWVRGFIAACPDAFDRHPMGAYEVRDMRDAVRRALDELEMEKSS
jgi:hypothetical protein